ncbi:TonB-dependent receptor plug domain-containing protein [Azospirillum sp. ST 5-10]|uniref:TonB-dependent receptor plug domain-containing protein n=1 Tax=unclassified Azospirillum TaxID=2630922 RepID=UPI003F4A1B9E
MTSRLFRSAGLSGVSVAALFATLPAAAQDVAEPVVVPDVVVSATRLATAPDKVGSSVTVISGESIEEGGKPELFDALQGVPGVSLSRNGGMGATSTVRLRGAESAQTQVLIDGVLVNDPANANGEFDFDALAVTGIDRIEVLRGPQSALYGNDAMGGVISVVTKRGRGPLKVSGLAEAGSHNTWRLSAGASGGTERFGYAVNATSLGTDGFSAFPGGDEADGARNRALTAKVGADLTDTWTVDVAAGIFDLRSDYDETSRDAPYVKEKTLRYGKIDNTVFLLDGRLENVFTLSGTSTDRSFDEPGGYIPHSNYSGSRWTAEYRANYQVDDTDVLTVGALHEVESARIVNEDGGVRTVGVDDSVDTNAVYGQYLLGLWDDLSLTFGVRHDRNEEFGPKTTVRTAAAYAIDGTGTTLRASIGTAGKAPTLFQLYDPTYGNPGLSPESSVGADAGVEQTFLGKRATVSATVFWNRFSDLIAFDDTYQNIEDARTWGVESAAALKVSDALRLTASYTFLRAENLSTGRELPRRPHHQASLGAVWQVTDAARVGGTLRFVGEQLDSTYTNIRNDAYTVVDLQASYAVTPAVSAFGRIENLFDADYQEVARYNSSGRAFYAGIKASF